GRRGYKIGLVLNWAGTLATTCSEVGLAPYVEYIGDSTVFGRSSLHPHSFSTSSTSWGCVLKPPSTLGMTTTPTSRVHVRRRSPLSSWTFLATSSASASIERPVCATCSRSPTSSSQKRERSRPRQLLRRRIFVSRSSQDSLATTSQKAICFASAKAGISCG